MKTHRQMNAALSRLDPSHRLESIPLSRLARTGTSLLRKLVETGRPVAVTVQGQGSMVALSQQQYDEMVRQIRQLETEDAREDTFTQALGRRFDTLMEQMNRADSRQAIEAALFGEPDALNASYRPGDTEEKA